MTTTPVSQKDRYRVVETKPKYLTLDPKYSQIYAPGQDEETEQPWLILDDITKANLIVEALNLHYQLNSAPKSIL